MLGDLGSPLGKIRQLVEPINNTLRDQPMLRKCVHAQNEGSSQSLGEGKLAATAKERLCVFQKGFNFFANDVDELVG